MDAAVIGAGLAGAEAAWQLAERGWRVQLHEMRPEQTTPAHRTGLAAEMVCSNSFKSDDPFSATGILKEEMRRLDSLILANAQANRVPAGQSLAVDRTTFAEAVTRKLRAHPRIHWVSGEVHAPDPALPTILATGPLTSDSLCQWLSDRLESDRLFFFDAIAPIVEADSIDTTLAFRASRYNKGGADFLNCPLNKEEYERFVDALLTAPRVELNEVDTPYFEACLPIEVMADRGRETLRHGPMKPVGLDDPRTGRWPHAAVQLRQDTLAGDHYNLVGFQTRLKWGAQEEVFRLIPGLEKAVFARLGSIHRNTYVQAPHVLEATLAVKQHARLWIAGQLSGVEGYLESAASGLAAALSVHRHLRGEAPRALPETTMLGSLLHYLAHANPKTFCPTNAMLGLFPPLAPHALDIRALKRAGGIKAVKAAKGAAFRQRSEEALTSFLGGLP
ncbi:MAG: methylenetetrahydrofolate--tRNA-(uracil(54)-C(5))-methyltransferase (FADH(2)-oxidizing) TrmFO [Firmicutes bacterium]|nr:methylenetetrahydrofolate--tRNA-(uracil(54)-C(5))-methyltransferase (FADH(2)-oxidizing) TrmFO [Bacillota bacterium]